MAKGTSGDGGYVTVPFRMHPRVFAALGADLVTNDVVAVIELVKNSYDAFARNVWVRFRTNAEEGDALEIEDDGTGMTRELIEDVWCLVATPFKEDNRVVKRGKETRRVAGEKGLGRLSVARLGEQLDMLTQAQGEDCWQVTVNWKEISGSSDMAGCYASCRRYPEKSPFAKSGTLLRIHGLKAHWDQHRTADLEENLARLISPFSQVGDFSIFLSKPGDTTEDEARIESPEFLSAPKYAIKGDVGESGNIKGVYRLRPLDEEKARKQELSLSWGQVYENIQDRTRFPFNEKTSHCGPFSFEIRAWDIAPEDAQEIAEKFHFQKTQVRKAIRVHQGVSVYRDGVLVLPKSAGARDWLGLDLRRVSKVGTRLSTSQIVGYVSISAEENTGIKDTSDRERLASSLEVAEFEELLKAVVALLENERDADRVNVGREKPFKDLFGALTAEGMVKEVEAIAEDGGEASEALPLLRDFSASLDTTRKEIQERFVYYSRLATVGTIAQMLVHEIRNRTTAFGKFLTVMKGRFGPFNDKELEEAYRLADNAVNALERLADTFSPLASRSFRRRQRNCRLEERINECLILLAGEITKNGIKCSVPESETTVSVDPGELDAILLNLITNSIYWLSEVPQEKREIDFRFTPIEDGTRLRVWVHDTGPGIRKEDIERIFWPGVTRKPGGIGMGLTVASELVAEYGGRMATKHPGARGGASFAFDLPLKG